MTLTIKGNPTPGQLVLALVELAAAYGLIVFPLLHKHVKHSWLIAAVCLAGVLGVLYVFGRLYKLAGHDTANHESDEDVASR